MPDTLISLGEHVFSGCVSLTSIKIPNGITSIGSGMFTNCVSLNTIDIPEGVTSIGVAAFRECTSLESITIPNSVKSVGEYAFYGCNSLKTVYYTGTEEQWKSIQINNDQSGNDYLINAPIYYYLESEPLESGNYWYYDNDGNIVIWS